MNIYIIQKRAYRFINRFKILKIQSRCSRFSEKINNFDSDYLKLKMFISINIDFLPILINLKHFKKNIKPIRSKPLKKK